MNKKIIKAIFSNRLKIFQFKCNNLKNLKKETKQLNNKTLKYSKTPKSKIRLTAKRQIKPQPILIKFQGNIGLTHNRTFKTINFKVAIMIQMIIFKVSNNREE